MVEDWYLWSFVRINPVLLATPYWKCGSGFPMPLLSSFWWWRDGVFSSSILNCQFKFNGWDFGYNNGCTLRLFHIVIVMSVVLLSSLVLFWFWFLSFRVRKFGEYLINHVSRLKSELSHLGATNWRLELRWEHQSSTAPVEIATFQISSTGYFTPIYAVNGVYTKFRTREP